MTTTKARLVENNKVTFVAVVPAAGVGPQAVGTPPGGVTTVAAVPREVATDQLTPIELQALVAGAKPTRMVSPGAALLAAATPVTSTSPTAQIGRYTTAELDAATVRRPLLVGVAAMTKALTPSPVGSHRHLPTTDIDGEALAAMLVESEGKHRSLPTENLDAEAFAAMLEAAAQPEAIATRRAPLATENLDADALRAMLVSSEPRAMSATGNPWEDDERDDRSTEPMQPTPRETSQALRTIRDVSSTAKVRAMSTDARVAIEAAISTEIGPSVVVQADAVDAHEAPPMTEGVAVPEDLKRTAPGGPRAKKASQAPEETPADGDDEVMPVVSAAAPVKRGKKQFAIGLAVGVVAGTAAAIAASLMLVH